MGVITSVIGIVSCAFAVQGYTFRPVKMFKRFLLMSAALLLIKPGLITDGIGVALLIIVFIDKIRFVSRSKSPIQESS